MPRYINADEYVIIPVVEKMDDEPSQLPITIGDLIKRTTKKEPIFADVREVMASAWIPVSERLPEENQKCLITTRWGWEYLAEYRFGYFYGERWDFETKDVTSWMPLPEPYRGDE